ncbi:MAG: BsaWI family type II restriction enzyme [Candidatus Poribacteria bacterium]|nr:BsaWI family type II restriction enzyme [Candidatus Poribacteria bacterium]
MKNDTKPIKAAPTATIKGSPTPVSPGELSGRKNILTDTLYEMGYDDTLVDILIERDVIDFDMASYTSHIMNDLIEHYGESVLCGGLEHSVVFEGLDASLTGELGNSWRASEGNTFRERIFDMIVPSIEKLGLKLVLCYDLVESATLSEELEKVQRHLTIDYGESNSILPYIDFDIVIYNPENSRVVAVISCMVNLRNRIIDMAYWRLKMQTVENTASIKFYLITTDLDETLKITDVPQKGRAIVETDLDGTYVLTTEYLEESDKIKLFEHFIEDFKKVIEENR